MKQYFVNIGEDILLEVATQLLSLSEDIPGDARAVSFFFHPKERRLELIVESSPAWGGDIGSGRLVPVFCDTYVDPVREAIRRARAQIEHRRRKLQAPPGEKRK